MQACPRASRLGGDVTNSVEGDRLRTENETLCARLSRLTAAILRISEDLELDTVLQEVMDGARSLTGARYAVLIVNDEENEPRDLMISGLTDQEIERAFAYPLGTEAFRHFGGLQEPLRTETSWPTPRQPDSQTSQSRPLLSAQIRIRDEHVGNLHIGDDESGADFTVEDEETLKMFAAQAAMAIANARRYGEEQRAKADLEAFLNTSPVGVLVLDAHTRGLVSINHGARRIIGLQSGEENDSAGDLGMVEFRRMDGTVMQPDEVPIERVLRTGETVYAEELVIVRPSGDQVTTLIKTTPIRSEDDQLVAVVATIQDITPLEELER